MYIFVEDKLVRLIEAAKFNKLSGNQYDTLLDAKLDKVNVPALKGHVLVQQVNAALLKKLFTFFIAKRQAPFDSLTLVVKDKAAARQQILNLYRVIYAAGGVVFNRQGDVLMMKRLGMWDLPKGKADEGETPKVTAEREVEEECGIKVKVGDRLCSTWHTYWIKDKPVIKRTKWYKMACTDESGMTPQTEEAIEELQWMNAAQRAEILEGTYTSIRFVLQKLDKTLPFQA